MIHYREAVRILVIEDDADLRLAVSSALRGAGFAVDAVADLPAADEALAVNAYDCAVFDRMLPSGDALGYVRARRVPAPVLFLTALDSIAHRVEGLEHGDDYLVKPFALDELIARVRTLCRLGPTMAHVPLRCGDLEMDVARHQVRRGAVLLGLTGKEFAVLEHLLAHQDRVVTRDELLAGVWDALVRPESNVLDVTLSSLRRKLGDPPVIHTVPRVGYRVLPG
ncbi:DNA-binding response regulator [Actinokineospora fastidiosa]|uniref:DNA-binding response regulator n=1 Tax=Actinokineospora fastidiosa TaxID=1816 RepID=A0A918LJG0_9PSEU|nr:DNA-binding response regulator [Actinokineospora fastidiosa]